MRPQVRRALRWAAGILGVAVLLGVATIATLAAQISGGWDEVFDTTKPLPNDPEVVTARQEGAARVDAETDRLIADVVLPALPGVRVAQPALSGAEALASATGHPPCITACTEVIRPGGRQVRMPVTSTATIAAIST